MSGITSSTRLFDELFEASTLHFIHDVFLIQTRFFNLKAQKIRVLYEVIPEPPSHVPIALETSGVGIEMDVSTEAH